ncbi:hypothetical protein ACHAW6_012493 [Cyclotella cf. meneghiniana]
MGQLCSFCGSQDEAKKSTAFADNGRLSDDVHDHDHHSHQHAHSSSPFSRQQTPETGPDVSNHNLVSSSHGHDAPPSGHPNPHDAEHLDEKERERRLKQFQLEQAELARREAIVNAASQSMIPVGGSQSGAGGGMMNHAHHTHHRAQGGIYTYYDPSYAAAAAQDILNSAARTGGLMFADDEATRAAWNVSVIGFIPVAAGSNRTAKDLIDTLGKGRWDGVKLGSRGSGVAGCGGEDPEYFLDDLAEAFLETMVPTKTNLFGGCPSIVENLL